MGTTQYYCLNDTPSFFYIVTVRHQEHVWVFGDSIAYWALKHMLKVNRIADDYYGTNGVIYHNLAVRGAKVQDVAAQVQYEIEFTKKLPTLIIVNVGMNNFNQDQLTLKQAICNLMVQITNMTIKYPDEHFRGVMFSAILPCRAYLSMQSFKKGIAKTKAVNSMVRNFLNNTTSSWFLPHNNISPRCSANFRKGDNVHLANPGIKLFIDNIVAKVNEIVTAW